MTRKIQQTKERLRGLAEELLSKALTDDNGRLYWPFSNLLPAHESIYYGSGGIIIFLLETYAVLGDLKYLEAAKSTGHWTIDFCKKRAVSNNFYTGRLGAIYALIRLAEDSGMNVYTECALHLIDELDLSVENKRCDLINGIAGDLLGWICLRNKIKHGKIDLGIKTCVTYLIEQVQFLQPGQAFWGSPYLDNEFLNGFAHGPSGICYVLSLFDHDLFHMLKEHGISFEDNSFLEDNWGATDKGIHKDGDVDRYREHYRDGQRKYAQISYKNISWCNGAIGMSLFRYEEKREELFLRAAQKIGQTFRDNIGVNEDFCLCHGTAGVGMFFNSIKEEYPEDESTVQLNVFNSFDAYQRNKNGLFVQHEKFNGDMKFSLFLGNVGIGYYYCKVLGSPGVNLLLPKFEKIRSERIFSVDKLSFKLLVKLYPRTFSLFNKEERLAFIRLINYKTNNFLSSLQDTIRPHLIDDKRKAAFDFENKLISFNHITTSKPFGYAGQWQTEIDAKNILKEENLSGQFLKVSASVMVIQETWDWTTAPYKKQSTFILVKNNLNKIAVRRLSKLAYQVCDYFGSGNTFHNFEGSADHDELIKQQLVTLVSDGVLVKNTAV